MGIATPNLPSFSAADEVLVNQTVNGLKRVGRLPLGSLADQLMGIEPLSGVAEVVEVVDQLAAPRNSVEGGYAPKIAAYGDSNTRHYNGDSSNAGPYANSYGYHLDVLFGTSPAFYRTTLTVSGHPSMTAEWGLTNLNTYIPASLDFLILGWGTNNIKLDTPDLDSYLGAMEGIIDARSGAVPIILAIPWFSATYGDNDLIPVWNEALYKLCLRKGGIWIDTYNLGKGNPDLYYIENSTPKRHWNIAGQKAIARMILRELNRISTQETYPDTETITRFAESPYLITADHAVREQYNEIGGKSMSVLKVPAGSSVKFRVRGNWCVGFYPREDATVTVATELQTQEVTITDDLDAGYFFPIKRVAGSDAHYYRSGVGNWHDVLITAVTGDAFIRSVSSEEGFMSYTNTSSNAGTASVLYNNDMWFGTVTQLLAVCPTPANARYGREYFVTSLGYAVISDGAQWLSPLGIRAIGTTTERDAITYKPTGYKFSNTTTGTIQTWSGSAWV